MDFVIADTGKLNGKFINKFYNTRSIRSLKGKVKLLTEFSNIAIPTYFKYLSGKLSAKELERIATESNGSPVKIIEVNDPYYASFMKDIDTMGDYQTYLNSFKED